MKGVGYVAHKYFGHICRAEYMYSVTMQTTYKPSLGSTNSGDCVIHHINLQSVKLTH